MTHDPKTNPDLWLDDLLDDVAAAPLPETPSGLMARVLADAEHLLPAPGGAPAPVPLWRQIIGGLGGWGALGGMAVAGVTGLAVGLGAFDATSVDALWSAGFFDGYDSQTGLSAYGWDFEEG